MRDLVVMSLQIAGISVLAEVLTRSLARRNANVGYRMWLFAAILVLAIIPLHCVTNNWRWTVVKAVPISSQSNYQVSDGEVFSESEAEILPVADFAQEADRFAEVSDIALGRTNESAILQKSVLNNLSLSTSLAVIYVIGVLLMLLRLIVGLIRLTMIALKTGRCSSEIQELADLIAKRLGLKSSPVLLLQSKITAPFVFGTWQPKIVLPSSFTAWSDAEQKAVLLHELAHVQRHDFAWNLVAKIDASDLLATPGELVD